MNTDACWICGQPAERTCPQCGQPVCEAHIRPIPEAYQDVFGTEGCEVCVTRTLKDVRPDTAPRAAVVQAPPVDRTCAYDGEEFDEALPRCEVCGRHVCPKHRHRYRRKLYVGSEEFKSAYYWEYKVRCWEHPWRWYRWRGWEKMDESGEAP